MYYTYMLRCEDDSIYTGITTDIERRMEEHFGKGEKCAKYTKTHTAQKLEACFSSDTRKTASQLEYRIKKLKKEDKEKLIKNKSKKILKTFFEEKIEEINKVKRVKEISIKSNSGGKHEI